MPGRGEVDPGSVHLQREVGRRRVGTEDGGLAVQLREVRGIEDERDDAVHGRGAADEEWIPKIASKRGVILTQDVEIHRTKAQWELCQQNKIGVFFFKAPRKGWTHWMIVREVVNRWEEICRSSATTTRPFGWVIEPSRAKMRRL